MKYLFLFLVSSLISMHGWSQASDTLYLRNGMKISCKVTLEGPITIDYKTASKEKHKLKPTELDSIRYADGTKSRFKHTENDEGASGNIDDDEVSDLLGVVKQKDSISGKAKTHVADSVKPKKQYSASDMYQTSQNSTQRQLDSLTYEFQKLNKRIDLQCMQNQASGVYLKRAGYYFSGMLVTSIAASTFFVLASYYSTMSTPQGMKLANTLEVLGYIGGALSLGCYVAIPINLVNAGKVLHKKKLF